MTILIDDDGLIIGSPTYASNVSGLLKVFIERGHFVIEQLLYGKYAICVATGENYGSNDNGKVLNKLMRYFGGLLTGKIVYNTPFNTKIVDDKLNNRVAALVGRYYLDIKNKRNHPIQSVIHNSGDSYYCSKAENDKTMNNKSSKKEKNLTIRTSFI